MSVDHTRTLVPARFAPVILTVVLLATACTRSDPAADSAAAATSTVSREQAVRLARQFISRDTAVVKLVYLDSAEVSESDSIWHVMFRRRALVVPAVVTVDVDRHTGAMRFPGDE
jgi:hypothetical protein